MTGGQSTAVVLPKEDVLGRDVEQFFSALLEDVRRFLLRRGRLLQETYNIH